MLCVDARLDTGEDTRYMGVDRASDRRKWEEDRSADHASHRRTSRQVTEAPTRITAGEARRQSSPKKY